VIDLNSYGVSQHNQPLAVLTLCNCIIQIHTTLVGEAPSAVSNRNGKASMPVIAQQCADMVLEKESNTKAFGVELALRAENL
jgi:hypothetical protein